MHHIAPDVSHPGHTESLLARIGRPAQSVTGIPTASVPPSTFDRYGKPDFLQAFNPYDSPLFNKV